MIIPFSLKCPICDETEPAVDIRLDDHSPCWACKNGHSNQAVFDLDFTVGYKILCKSWYEFSVRKDYSMCIVFAAMAFECEVSFLYTKWMQVESHLANGPWLKDEDVENELRRMPEIDRRIEAVCKKMSPLGLDEFVRQTTEFKDAITTRFPSLTIGTLAKDFQRTIFWPRNRILHYGYTGHEEPDAARCASIAELGIRILSQLDKAKRLAVLPA
jgi:hypothetical protein